MRQTWKITFVSSHTLQSMAFGPKQITERPAQMKDTTIELNKVLSVRLKDVVGLNNQNVHRFNATSLDRACHTTTRLCQVQQQAEV